ncbi:MAG: hypothetical protein A3H52_02270 [Candidatus Zambryskibacteria bacterium RIFCSPLOWO2_02_FULL_39_26]|nr:MAG: hypothetical protein A3H52_02270 [Candidatus Zambryskibacteria bacterium RIFCSPLOWO2_02_FULL_39_26]
MTSFHIKKIPVDNSHSILKEFLLKRGFIPVFLFSPYVLNTWLTHAGKSLYTATYDNEQVLLVHKEQNNDIRVLFDHPKRELQDALMKYFNPKYFAVNECSTPPQSEKYLTAQEVEIVLAPIANLTEKSVRKKYNQFIRKYPELFFESYTSKHVELIKIFIEKWNTTRTEEKNKFSKTENDLHFLELYKDDPKLIGGVVMDKGEIVSISLCVPSLDNSLLAVINKCLRGYSELGVFTYVERARYLIKQGFSRAYIGAINNEFKKQFLKDAILRDVFCYEIYKASDFEVTDKYLFRVF